MWGYANFFIKNLLCFISQNLCIDLICHKVIKVKAMLCAPPLCLCSRMLLYSMLYSCLVRAFFIAGSRNKFKRTP